MKISAGKLRGMRRLADASGRYKMVAVDQRPPMLNGLKPVLAPRLPDYSDLSRIKTLLAERLAPQGSALLIDPDYGYSGAQSVIPAHCGVLITLEDYAFAETEGGRKTSSHPNWDVGKIKRMGADGVKLLLWYRPDAAADVIEHQKAYVTEIGDACRKYDIPFLLELLVYPFKGTAGHTTDYTEDKAKRPELVIESLKDFADPRYGIDIYKLESPVTADSLPDPDSSGADVDEAQGWFNRIGETIDRPWVMLSAGAGMDEFHRVLGFAYRAGANGYLAGRAIWSEAFRTYPDMDAMDAALTGKASDYMADINSLTDRLATPWVAAPAIAGSVELEHAGQTFPDNYAGM